MIAGTGCNLEGAERSASNQCSELLGVHRR
jgi:hypothetical protein